MNMNKKIKNIIPVIFHESDMGSIKLNPNWISGFVAGEGSFIITKSNDSFSPKFSICLTRSDQHILWTIWVFFGKFGNVYETHGNTATLTISCKKGLKILIDFFDKYPILGNKALDYAAFREVVILKERNQHNTKKGYKRCIELFINQNTGRNYYNPSQRAKIIKKYEEIKDYNGPKLTMDERKELNKVKNIVKKVGLGKDNIPPMELNYTIEKKNFVNEVKLDPNWISGQTSGEGCFFIGISKKLNTNTAGCFQVKPQFKISQTRTNQHQLWAIQNYFGIGSVNKGGGSTMASYSLSGINDIYNIIIPFFDKYPILGYKAYDFEDFKEVLNLMKQKLHLTSEGQNKCKEIKERKNTNRIRN